MNKQRFIEYLQEKLPDDAHIDNGSIEFAMNRPVPEVSRYCGTDGDGFAVMKPVQYVDSFDVKFSFSTVN